MLAKFCKNPNKDNFDKLDFKTQTELVKFSKYSIKNNKGNIDIAKSILNISNDDWDILIHASNINKLERVKRDNTITVDEKFYNSVTKIIEDEIDPNIKFNFIENLVKNNTKNLKPIQKKLGSTYFGYIPAIYTHYLFNDLSYKGKLWHYDLSTQKNVKKDYVIWGISPKVFYNLDFVACNRLYQGRCFLNKKDVVLIQNSKKNPNLNKLKNHINETIKEEKDNVYKFGISHEILFDKIPLKYINVIFTTTKSTFKKAKELFPNIRVELMDPDEKNYKELLKPFAF
jgi:hypothetical protein